MQANDWLDVTDPEWDAQDKLAYLLSLQQALAKIEETRGKLIDCFGNDRNDLLETQADGELTPLIAHVKEDTAAKFAQWIQGIRQEEARIHTLTLQTRLGGGVGVNMEFA